MASPTMARSLSAVERNNPPPRRKSCLACIKAKRRCDLGSPACLRCRQRKMDCTYPPGTTPRRAQVAPPASHPTPPDSDLDVALDLNLPSSHSCQDYPVPVVDPMSLTLDPSMGMLNDILEVPGGSHESLLDTLLRPYAFDFVAPMDLSPPLKTSISPPLSDSPTESKLRWDWIVKTRLRYSIDTIAAAPRQMVEKGQMPWCHRHLYTEDAPRSIQDAISSAALYMAKNDVNADMIHNCVESRVQDLLSSPMPTSGRDILARAHALLIYQILRVFDNDIRTRAMADTIEPQLESVAFSLLAHITWEEANADGNPKSLQSLPLYPISETRDFWRSWIFQESARRTFLLTFFFLQAYRLMIGKGSNTCDARLYLAHSWTLSAHLWEANDPIDFAMAWREKKHLIVTNTNITESINRASGDDVDSYGKILISAMLGVDECKGWLAIRGGVLE
ncbi:hypothetical protein GQ53DRAFT_675852 [Thozetella sp. PMI_491]|nr:hypothetical protein GQ53DRAFT_675852 [Thozetella sp. PMI_491]